MLTITNHSAIFAFAGAIAAGALALTVAWYERRSTGHRAYAVGMLLLGMESYFAGMAAKAVFDERRVYWETFRLMTMALLPGVWLFFSFSYARGNYREFIDKWRSLLIGTMLVPPVVAFLFYDRLIALQPVEGTIDQWAFRLSAPGLALYLIFLVSTVLVLMNLERTFQTSVGTMRWRIKFMVLGLGVFFAVRAYSSSQAVLFGGINPSLQPVNSFALLCGCVLMLRSLLREGHFEVNVYPSHAVLHKSLTALLAGIYLVIVGIFAQWVRWKGNGNAAAFTLEAFIVLVSLVALTVVLLSNRVQLHLRRFVSRHFQRPLYDYRTVWRSFTQGTASRTDQMELCRVTVKLVADVFEVLSVTIWLVDDKNERLTFAASTLLSESKAEDLGPQGSDTKEVLQALRNHPDPVDITLSKENWAAALRRCQPEGFRRGGNRVGVPMLVGGEVVGLMLIGDRVGGTPFSLQDFDLLRCVGDQLAASLLNAQLSQKLLQAKEMEAFQTMSAFFVHDLKNTASTLNLMLKNLPVHFDDPAFRADALRGIGKTVSHINNLIERLSLLRHGLQMLPTECDLNEVVGKALAGWKSAAGVELAIDLQPVPRIWLDQDQILKVVTNLVLNATEALTRDGRIQVATGHGNGWAFLSVKDNGCGMSAEFLNRSLFRPFQTTKKKGLGIGMFQSKMIVEAHKGRMEVESEAGKGTTFRILLPLQKQTK